MSQQPTDDELLHQILGEQPASSSKAPSAAAKDQEEALLAQILSEPAKTATAAATAGSPPPRPPPGAAPDDDALLAQILGEKAEMPSGPSAASPARSSLALSPQSSTASTARGASVAGRFALESFDEEQMVLEAMLRAIEEDEDSVDSNDLSLDMLDVDRVVDHASRIARGEVDSTADGAPSLAAPGTSKRGGILSSEKGLMSFRQLHDIAAEMKRAQTTTGAVTCFATSTSAEFKFAAGTSYGVVLIFSENGKVRGVCGNVVGGGAGGASDERPRGSVASLSMIPTGEAVLAGYEEGHVIWWETRTSQPIKVVTDDLAEPVLRVLTLEDIYKTASVNALGVLKVYNLSRVMTKWVVRTTVVEHRLPYLVTDIASVCAPEEAMPLSAQGNGASHFLAVACKQVVKVFRVSFDGTSTQTADMPTIQAPTQNTDAVTMTTAVAWRAAPMNLEEPELSEAHLLVIAWSSVVTMHRIDVFTNTFEPAGVIPMPYSLCGLCHYTSNCTVGLSSVGDIVVLDVHNAAIVDTCVTDFDVPPVSTGSGGATTGLPRPRKSLMLQHLICTDGGHAFVAPAARVFEVSMKSWEDRVQQLVNAREWDGALEYALQCYTNTAVGAIGMSDFDWARREQVTGKMTMLIGQYVTFELQAFNTRNTEAMKTGAAVIDTVLFFYNLGNTLCSICAQINSYEVLFGPVYAAFIKEKQEEVFLYLLEEHIVGYSCSTENKDDPSYSAKKYRRMMIQELPDMFIDQLTQFFTADDAVNVCARLDGLLAIADARKSYSPSERLEQCLMRLTKSVESALRRATSKHLYRAMSMLYCVGMDEFSIPLTQLIALDTPDSLKVLMEYMVLVCRGATFLPEVPVPATVQKQLLSDIVVHACTKESMAKLFRVSAESYVQLIDKLLYDPDVWRDLTGRSITQQSVVEELVQLVLDFSCTPLESWTLVKREWPTFADTTKALVHILRYFVSHLYIPSNPKDLVTRAFSALCYDVKTNVLDADEVAARQNVLMGVVRCRHRPELDWRQLQQLAESAGFHSVVVVIYEIQGRHKIALQHLLSNVDSATVLKTQVFEYLTTALLQFTQLGKDDDVLVLTSAIVEHARELCSIDGAATAQLVMQHLPRYHDEVMANLHDHHPEQFSYLCGMIFRDNVRQRGQTVMGKDAEANPGREMASGLQRMQHMRDFDALATSGIDLYDVGTQNRFISLLCQYQPNDVYFYLMQNEGRFEYDIETTMHLCKRHRITDAQTFLLEKTNQISQAMSLLIMTLTTKLLEMRQSVVAAPDDDATMNTFSEVTRYLDVGVQLCLRNHQHLDEHESRNVWFALLDRFVKPRQAIALRLKCEIGPLQPGQEEDYKLFNDLECDASPVPAPATITVHCRRIYKILQRIYSEYMKHVLSFMMKHLPPAAIWSKIQQDNPSDTYGEFKYILSDILDHFSYSLETTLRCSRIMAADNHQLGETLRYTNTHPIINNGETCLMCSEPLGAKDGVESLRYFTCGHIFHEPCCPYARCTMCMGGGGGAAVDPRRAKSVLGAALGATRRNTSSRADGAAAASSGGGSGGVDEKALRRIMNRIERVRKRLYPPSFVSVEKLCDDSLDVAAAMVPASQAALSLSLAPLRREPPEDLQDRVPGKLPSKPKHYHKMTPNELEELFGEEVLESLRERKEQRQTKQKIEAKKEKILSGKVDWDEDDADALAWDS